MKNCGTQNKTESEIYSAKSVHYKRGILNQQSKCPPQESRKRDVAKMVSKKTQSPPSSIDTSKLCLFTEQLSVRITWVVAEKIFHNWRYKKRIMRQMGGADTWYSQRPYPWVGSAQSRGYYNCRHSPQGLRGLNSRWAPKPVCPAPERWATRTSGFEATRAWIGEGNGTPLQYSCLENPMDGGAW